MNDTPAWHCLSVREALARQQTSKTGLTDDEAAERLQAHGPNALPGGKPLSAWRILLSQFQNILIFILLLAVALSALVGETVDALVIGVILVFSIGLGFIQEYRAGRAMEALREMAAPRARVLRDGRELSIPARELVPGDLLLLATGDRLAADARLIEAVNLATNEAALTGESTPVDKETAALDEPDLGIADRLNLVYSGTDVVSGRGRALVIATGLETEFGRVTGLLSGIRKQRTPLQRNLDRVGRLLAIGAGLIVLLVVGLGILRGEPLLEMLLFGVALAVAVVPEALPAVVTISLAIGVQRMAKRHALIRHLPTVETLGSTSVICADKTGTLTRDQMRVRAIWTPGGLTQVNGQRAKGTAEREEAGIVPPDDDPRQMRLILELLQAAILCNDARLQSARPDHPSADANRDPADETASGCAGQPRETPIAQAQPAVPNMSSGDPEGAGWTLLGDPTEGALILAGVRVALDKAELESCWPRIDEIPFSSERKRMTTLHRKPADECPEAVNSADVNPANVNPAAEAASIAFSKGAAEIILDACDRIQTLDGEHPLDTTRRQAVEAAGHQMATQALRVLAIARKPLREDPGPADPEHDMVFLGLVGMMDPPRKAARQSIADCQRAGIRPVMITGDHPETARAIARELGILDQGALMVGRELDDLTQPELEARIKDIQVFARVSPEHKLRVVQAWQQRGHVCAMTGDGVNDAPALKRADIGVAMGITGTDVSREAADMTLTDDNFASIVGAVEEGRGIFANIRKYLMYLLSSNLGEIGLIAGAAIAGMPLPLSAVQILYVNLASDGLPALALALDPPDQDLMDKPPRDPRHGLFTRPVIFLMLLGALWSMGINLWLFSTQLAQANALGLDAETGLARAMTMTFVSLVLLEFFKAFCFRSERVSLWQRPFANRWLNLAVLWEFGLLMAVIYLPLVSGAFGSYPLAASDWPWVLGTALSIIPVLEFGKWVNRRWMPEGPVADAHPRRNGSRSGQ